MWHDSIYDLTPVEKIGDVWFKREDKFSPDGIHNGSKFRQLIWLFSRAVNFPGVVSGAVTGSPQLPMVAACAKHYGMACVQFTGAVKNMAKAGEDLGANTLLVNPGYGPLLNRRAKDYAAEHGWLHIETNITVTTSDADIEAFHRVGSRQVENLPDHIETLMIPAGSRNSVCSILYGLWRKPMPNLKRIILFNIAPGLKKREDWMAARLDAISKQWATNKGDGDKEWVPLGLMAWQVETYDLVDSGYTTYDQLRPFSYGDLHCHPRYEGKCFHYIKDNLEIFRPYINDKTLFWIVGSEPGACLVEPGPSHQTT
jgi:hypothetical protein